MDLHGVLPDIWPLNEQVKKSFCTWKQWVYKKSIFTDCNQCTNMRIHWLPKLFIWYNHSKPDQSNIVWGFSLAYKNLLITFLLPASLRVLAYLHTMNGPQRTAVSRKESWQKQKQKGISDHLMYSLHYSSKFPATGIMQERTSTKSLEQLIPISPMLNFWTPP